MIYGSVCSGIEAATAAWHPLGWRAAWFSEIEKFPSAVLVHRWAHTPNLGDMTKIHKKEEFSGKPIDVLVGGTPCQSFSVAGLRKGLADPRGNLALVFLGLVDKARPKWVVWENVPGVLSSGKGRDFGAFLGGLAELGYGFAYRVLDAQYFGVPQSRRRVFVVGRLGDWRPAAAVLFEYESLSGDPAPSRKKRQGSSRATETGVELCGPLNARDYKDPGTDGMNRNSAKMVPVSVPEISPAIKARDHKGPSSDGCGDGAPIIPVVYENHPNDSRVKETGETGPTVSARWGTGGGNTPLVGQPIAIQGSMIGRNEKSGPWGSGVDASGNSFTLTKTDVHAVAFEPGYIARKAGPKGEQETVSTLRAEMGDNQPAVRSGMMVRRLTPRECERLQGFPDDYTQIPWRGGATPDGLRYKALGNSMAVPVMRWIGKRISEVEKCLQ